jgi:hypothetical protein
MTNNNDNLAINWFWEMGKASRLEELIINVDDLTIPSPKISKKGATCSKVVFTTNPIPSGCP